MVLIGKDGKNVIVKHGGILKEVVRIHVTRIKKGKRKTKKEKWEKMKMMMRKEE